FRESASRPFAMGMVPIVDAEIGVVGAVQDHVVDGPHHRIGDREDRLLRSAAGANAPVASAEIAVLRSARRPRALRDGCLEPASPLGARALAFLPVRFRPGLTPT